MLLGSEAVGIVEGGKALQTLLLARVGGLGEGEGGGLRVAIRREPDRIGGLGVDRTRTRHGEALLGAPAYFRSIRTMAWDVARPNMGVHLH